MIVRTGMLEHTVGYVLIGAEDQGWQSTHHQSADFGCQGYRAALEINGGGEILDVATYDQRARTTSELARSGGRFEPPA
jgi:hypothetical protein